jgi:hypothetical protein
MPTSSSKSHHPVVVPKEKSHAKKSTASSSSRKTTPGKPKAVPTKLEAAQNIAMAAKQLLKLSNELKGPR